MLGWLRGVHLRSALVCHLAQWATKFTIHPRALHGADNVGLSHFAYWRTYSPCADASGQRFDLGYHAAVSTRMGADYGLPLFQSSGMAVLVLDRVIPRNKISKTRRPAIEATQVATGDCCPGRGSRVAQSAATIHRKHHWIRPLLAPILRFGRAAG